MVVEEAEPVAVVPEGAAATDVSRCAVGRKGFFFDLPALRKLCSVPGPEGAREWRRLGEFLPTLDSGFWLQLLQWLRRKSSSMHSF